MRRSNMARRRPHSRPRRLWLAVAALAWSCSSTEPERSPSGEEAGGREARANELFAAHCAVCHGASGGGDGPAYPWLFPRARDFTSGRFRLASTSNGVPSDADLVRTLRRGIPGSAMPAFAGMSERDLADLAWLVREMAVAGLSRRLRAEGLVRGDGFAVRSAGLEARARLEPGPELGRLGAASSAPEVLELGSRLYSQHCAGCHGEDGRGDREPRLNEDGSLNWARDFTAGFLKGGASPTELGWRIRTGLPGTAMPAFSFDQDELAALVAHVRRLIPPGSETRLVHERRTLQARRVGELSTGVERLLEDPRWTEADWTPVVLAPLHWNEQAVLGAELAAMHDGRRIAVALRWNDPTGEPRIFSDLAGQDGAALQLTTAERPALFGMGTLEHPTTIWHWTSLRVSDVAGALDLVEQPPHALGEPFSGGARSDVPLYERALDVPRPSTEADELAASGVGQPLRAAPDGQVEALPRWFDGQWTVVFTRALEPPAEMAGEGRVALRPGSAVQFALAVWNGAAGDQRGQKSISIWHALELER